MAEIAVTLSSESAEKLISAFVARFNFLLREEDIIPTVTLSLALSLKGTPPSLRMAFPTENQMREKTTTRDALLIGDLLWLCHKRVRFHKHAAEVIKCLKNRKYKEAIKNSLRLFHGINGIINSYRTNQKQDILKLIRRHEQQLVIFPYLLSRMEKRIEPLRIRRRLDDGGLAADSIPSDGQTRKFSYDIAYRALYAAGCFNKQKRFEEAAKYYNAVCDTQESAMSGSYMRKLYIKFINALDTQLLQPIKPVKQETG